VTDWPAPSYEEMHALLLTVRGEFDGLRSENAALRTDNEALRTENQRLAARVVELELRLGQNSSNSSRPPSSDGLGKPAPKSLRRKGARKPGGQAGHEGSTLKQVAEPDVVVEHRPHACDGCGAGLDDAEQVATARRQVFDVPPVAVHVTEHRITSVRCGCGTVTEAIAPDGVLAPVQYGPRVAAAAVYLNAEQHLSRERTAQALHDLLAVPVSPGTVTTMVERAAAAVDASGVLDTVRERIAAADVAHFDETGLRVAGSNHWVHSASTGMFSLLTVHRRRGREAMDHAGVLPGFRGVAVHDAWAPYDTYTPHAHALCGAHLLRELVAVHETVAADAFSWAGQAIDALLGCKKLVDSARDNGTGVDADALARQAHLLRSAALVGRSDTAHRGDPVTRKHHALATRIVVRFDDYLRFTTRPDVPFDNNPAEREIRMVKLSVNRPEAGGLARVA
jgi:transposase